MSQENERKKNYMRNPTPKTYLLHKLSRESLLSGNPFQLDPTKIGKEAELLERSKPVLPPVSSLSNERRFPSGHKQIPSLTFNVIPTPQTRKFSPWTPSEDMVLYKAVMKHGANGRWEMICRHLTNRMPSEAWRRWEIVKSRVNRPIQSKYQTQPNKSSISQRYVFHHENNYAAIPKVPKLTFHFENSVSSMQKEKIRRFQKKLIQFDDNIVDKNVPSGDSDVIAIKKSERKMQKICCIDGCNNEVQNRSRFSLRCDYAYRSRFLKINWNKICTKHYFADLYRFKKKEKKKKGKGKKK